MFTGLVEEVGTVRSVHREGESLRLTIKATHVSAKLAPGDSVCIEGACQTAVRVDADRFEVDTLAETLRKTAFSRLRPGSPVNLELALRAADRLGGHIVQGHVDGVGTVRAVEESGRNVYLAVRLPDDLIRYCVGEGSIAVSGVSLTIARLDAQTVTMNIIPETWKRTTLRACRVGDPVNIEVDILARYVERLLPGRGDGGGGASALSAARLVAWGYGGER